MAIDVNAVIAEMESNVGFTDTNDDNPWGPEQGVGNNQPYCDSFASTIPYHQGYRWDGDSQFGERGDAYVPYSEDHAVEYGEAMFDHASQGNPADLQVGDQVTFDWNGNGDGDHIETVKDNHGDPNGPTFTTIGANTGTPKGVHEVERDRTYLRCRRRPRHYSDGAPPIGPPTPAGHPELRQGATGQAVVELQQKLSTHGHPVDVDGDFGPGTDAAVRAFQQENGLGVDGVVGDQTWSALDAVGSAPPPPSQPGDDTGVREGVDVSDYQDVDWGVYLGTGRRWAAIKVTEGTGYRSGKFNDNRANSAGLSGLVFYHFAGSSTQGVINDPVAEADFCIDNIPGGLRPFERIALDYELQYGKDSGFMNQWAAAFGRRITERTGTRPWFYSFASFIDANDTTDLPGIFDLWMASWGTNSPSLDRWDHYTAHQYTDALDVPGVSSACDDSHLGGSVTDIFGGHPAPPPPPPPPTPDQPAPPEAQGAVYVISVSHTEMVLDAAGAGKDPGTEVCQWPLTLKENQRWVVTLMPGGLWRIMGVGSRLVLEQPRSGAVMLQVWLGGDNQLWKPEPTGTNNSVILRNHGTGEVLDLGGASTAPGARVIGWAANGGSQQVFTFVVIADQSAGPVRTS